VRQGVDHALQVKPQPIRFDPAPKLSFDRPLDIEPFEFSSPRHMQMDEQLELAPTLHPLGVIGAFLLLHEEEGIQIVDLNRARSCLIGERAEAVTSQKLLIPLMLEFDQDEMAETSKILKSDDLETIESLGFRGEALPSIASVSKMTLTSGATVEVEGGKVLSVNPKQREGTHIEVRSLFFNTPVRRKFQKSVTSDVAAIHKVLIRLALCHPSIQFRWINEGEEKLLKHDLHLGAQKSPPAPSHENAPPASADGHSHRPSLLEAASIRQRAGNVPSATV
jgi:DNA mismatch repair ATPase MutL